MDVKLMVADLHLLAPETSSNDTNIIVGDFSILALLCDLSANQAVILC
jgi:hypothetical protein